MKLGTYINNGWWCELQAGEIKLDGDVIRKRNERYAAHVHGAMEDSNEMVPLGHHENDCGTGTPIRAL